MKIRIISKQNTRTNLFYNKLFIALIILFVVAPVKLKAQTLKKLENESIIDQQQKKQISGIVRDEQGLPAIVSIIEKGVTTNGTVTSVEGKFVLFVNSDAILVISGLGYLALELSTTGRTVFDVVLKEDVKILDEFIVVGYGTQSREKITTSVSKLDSKSLESKSYANIGSALQGGIAGLTVESYNGQPGLAPRIVMRGGTSINNPNGSTPLYVVDGVIRPHLNDIESADISSIQVLKDAAATSIYGARASNGVVLITTKTGREGATTVSFSYEFSMANPYDDIPFVSAGDYIVGARQSVIWNSQKVPSHLTKLNQAVGYGTGNDLTNSTAFTTQYLTDENKHKLNEGWQSVQDPLDPTKTIIYKETNFQKISKRTAYTNNYHLSAFGGTEKATYNISLGYLDAQGVALRSEYARLSYSMNGLLKISDNLKISGRLRYTNVNSEKIYSDPNKQTGIMWTNFQRHVALPSTAKFRFEDGSLAPGQSSSLGNPLYHRVGQHSLQTKNLENTMTLSINANWTILPGLSFEPQASLFETNVYNRHFQPGFLSGITNFNETRASYAYQTNNKHWQFGGLLTYLKDFGLHNLEIKLGAEYYNKFFRTINAGGKGSATNLIPTLNAAAEPARVGGSESEFVTEGIFSRINYDYNAKYLFSLNFRYDGASKLGANSRTGIFPGAAVGWNLHKESFWKKIFAEKLVQLKLRASYGQNGNIQGLGDYQAQGLYVVGSKYNDEAVILPSEITNPDLRWEKSSTFDLGFDLALFNQRVGLIFDLYERVTSDLLTNVALPGSSGFSSVLTNNGSLRNRGLELSLDAYVFNYKSDFQWKTSLTFSKVDTRILKLPDNGVEKNRQGGANIYDPGIADYVWGGGLQEGGRIGDLVAYHFLGVYATDEEAASAPIDRVIGLADKRKYGGDSKWADIDNNGYIDTYDRYVAGNIYPTVTGGFSNYFSYKGLSLNIRTDFTLGHSIHNYGKWFWDGQLQGDVMPTKEYYDRSWKKQGDVTDAPRYMWQNQQANFRYSDQFIEKGDFLAIREVSVAYQLPTRIVKKMKLSSLKLNFTGNNLHYFTKYRGMNPEAGGTDYGRYPNPKTFTFRVQISL